MQIKKKLPLTMITLICVPLVILALIIYVYSSKALVIKSKDNISQLVATEGRALEGLIQAKKYQVQVLASDERIINVLETQWLQGSVTFSGRVNRAEHLLKQIAMEEEDCKGIYVINDKGNIVASSEEVYFAMNIGKNKNFQRVLLGESIFKNIVTEEEKENYTIDMTVPVKNEEGRVLGAVCKVVYNTSFSNFIEEIKINETGFAYILDSEACIIAHPDKAKVGSNIENRELVSIISSDSTVQSMDKSVIESKEDGILKYIAFYQIPNINWTIIISQNASEVQRQAVMEFVIIIVAIVILVLLLSIATMYLSQKITVPIEELVNVMGEVSKGKLDEYCRYDADDEFGSLSKHYNQMIKSLSESREERERMLCSLEKAQEELNLNIVALTESKEALSISEARYRATLDDIEETIWEYDIKTGEVLVTGKWNEIVSENGKKSEGIFCEEIIEQNSLEAFKKEIEKCKAGCISVFSKELVLQGLGQQVSWGLCKGKVVYNEVGEIVKIRGIITDITNYKLSEEQVRRLAYFDVLTGCLNKQAFMNHMRECMASSRKGERAVLFFIDLDDFKKVNDTLGHNIGDKVLGFVAGRLKGLMPADSLVSRFGGDEFVIYKNNIENIEEVEELVDKILAIFKEKIVIGEHIIHSTCSIGIALYPLDGTSCETLLKNADTAMYKAKEQGKNSYSFYAEDMSKALARKLVVEGALREAIGEQRGLYLQYQPIVEVETGKTIGAEALVRLRTDGLGFVSPGEFIPVAEETGLIVEVGDWVMEDALQTLGQYRKSGCDNFSININVSAIQMKEKDFMQKLIRCIEAVNVPPQCVKLEVTETVLMQNLEESKVIFDQIKAMGIKLALDDFGTGYSSLNYLRNIPLDVLKIDKSFIDELTVSKELSEIVDSIINMAHILGIDVVAEGVESEEQLELLKEKGCDLIQGYVFSKPLMEEELNRRLQEEKIS